jgi:hypothetical protein
MNFQDESGLNSGIQEQDPTRGRGGFGLAQWTGPRRIQLEDYARTQGKPVDDPELQLDFFMAENAGPEAGAWKSVMNSPDTQTAAVNFVSNWERPAEKHKLARVARYQGDSPSEGGARFGGTGLGDPANPVPVTTPTAPEHAAVVKKPETWGQKFKAGLGDALSHMGEGMAGGGQAAPTGITDTPRAALAANQPTLIGAGDSQAADLQRQKLAMMMAKLNSQKLWV